jgi:hypothetical protein
VVKSREAWEELTQRSVIGNTQEHTGIYTHTSTDRDCAANGAQSVGVEHGMQVERYLQLGQRLMDHRGGRDLLQRVDIAKLCQTAEHRSKQTNDWLWR